MRSDASTEFYRVIIIEEANAVASKSPFLGLNSAIFEVINTYLTFDNAIDRLGKDCPDLIIIDIQCLGTTQIEGIWKIRKIDPAIRILVMTNIDEDELVFDALSAGAIGFISRATDQNELILAISQVIDGGAPLSPKIANFIIKSFHRNPRSPLTNRETVVLQHLTKGKTCDVIAQDLGISKDTVKAHMKHIYEKLHVRKKSEALFRAYRDNLV